MFHAVFNAGTKDYLNQTSTFRPLEGKDTFHFEHQIHGLFRILPLSLKM